MKENFMNTVAFNKPKRNHFDLSHDRKFTMRMGRLTPCLCMEVVPGDSVSLRSEQMIRFLPLVAPVMHKMDVYTHYWFVPNRLTWDGWEEFITAVSETPPVFPYVSTTGVSKSTIDDYLGVPVGNFAGGLKRSALPYAALGLIWNEFYRDQNLQDELESVHLTDGDNTASLGVDALHSSVPMYRAWEKDYFTAALPFQQKGAAVTLPLGETAPLVYDPLQPNGPTILRNSDDNLPTGTGGMDSNATGNITVDGDPIPVNADVSGHHYVDLAQATAASVNDLRVAIKLQEFLEKNARGGTRYSESIYVHFGVRTSDARLNRPEYLGGGKSNVLISEVLQTSQTEATGTAQGTQAGHGINVGTSHNFNRFFEEHGLVIGFISVMPKTAYSQGLPKQWTKFDFLDYLFPSFAHLGEAPVKNKEIFAQGTAVAADEETFGYNPIYSEYRQIQSTVHGEMSVTGTLKYWQMGRQFFSLPALSGEFVSSADVQQSEADIFAVGGDADNLIVHMFNIIHAKRPLPKFGIPSF